MAKDTLNTNLIIRFFYRKETFFELWCISDGDIEELMKRKHRHKCIPHCLFIELDFIDCIHRIFVVLFL